MLRKRKPLIIIFALLILLGTACQLTTENSVAIDVGGLEEECKTESIAESEEIFDEQPLEYKNSHINMKMQVNDKVKIVVDAQIIQPQYESVSVVRVSPENITKDQLNTLIKTVLPDNPVYYKDFNGNTAWSKEEIDGMLLYLESTWNNEKLNTKMRGDIRGVINELSRNYDNALSIDEERLYEPSSIQPSHISLSTSYELKSYLGKDRAADICLNESKDKKHTGLYFSNHNYFKWIRYIEPYSEEKAKGINLSYEESKKIAEDLVKKLDG